MASRTVLWNNIKSIPRGPTRRERSIEAQQVILGPTSLTYTSKALVPGTVVVPGTKPTLHLHIDVATVHPSLTSAK